MSSACRHNVPGENLAKKTKDYNFTIKIHQKIIYYMHSNFWLLWNLRREMVDQNKNKI